MNNAEPLSLHEYLSALSKDELIRLIEKETLFNATFAKSMQKLLPTGEPTVSKENQPHIQKEEPLERQSERMFPPVTKSSGVAEKIALFRSLFCSRTDVFALRWHNAETGVSGYSPVCKNKWASGKCNMKATPCSQCPNRDMAELTDTYIYSVAYERGAFEEKGYQRQDPEAFACRFKNRMNRTASGDLKPIVPYGPADL